MRWTPWISLPLLLLVTQLPLAATDVGLSPGSPATDDVRAQGEAYERPATYEMALREAWIPMPDGVRLAADLYMPVGGEPGEAHPVLLEYLPYRKTESRARNWALYSYFVQRGYVVARVDIRGTGNSEGRLIPHEYSDVENDDGEVVIDWLSRQDFSNGNVGMFGISWGGFNSIHMAMRNPPALKAIIAVDATDDLYQDDVHFMDGILHVDSWEMSQDLDNARPGAPDYVIDEDYFRNRFDTRPWMMTYKRQQRDGPFWDRTALKANYGAIRVPTFVIGGWYDGYRDSVPRMLEHLEAPVKAIVGPWAHAFPHDAYPTPEIEWRREAVRWFDHWLLGRDTGIMDEPAFAVYVREAHGPGPLLEDPVPGYWRWEDGWPIERIEARVLYPAPDHSLRPHPADPDAGSRVSRPGSNGPGPAGSDVVRPDGLGAGSAPVAHTLRYVPSTGIAASGPVMWWGDVAPDQRPTDAFSLVYDSAPLEEDLEILGLPRALLRVSADAPHANWVARLGDVAPDGTVTQVAGAAFNGTHRESAREPTPLEPGAEYDLDIEMHFTSWVFPAGHRIRLAVNNSQWPMLWPSRYPTTTQLHLGAEPGTRLVLPVVPRDAGSRAGSSSTTAARAADFPAAATRAAGSRQAEPGRPGPVFTPPADDPEFPGYERLETGTTSGYGEIARIERSVSPPTTRVYAFNDGAYRYPWGVERYEESIVHTTHDEDPADTSMRGEHRMTVELPDRTLVWEAGLSFSSDLENFYYEYTRRLFENGRLLRQRTWTEVIPRDHQ